MFKKHDYTLGVLWATAIFILPLPFIQTLEAGLPAIHYPQKLAHHSRNHRLCLAALSHLSYA
ncbi:hypothetical protein ACXO2Q_07295 [Lactobacillus delbrueckii subsp. bulgaricus]